MATLVIVASAPLSIKSGYNASMGKSFSSAREFEKHLKNMGCHVASKEEIESSAHGSQYSPEVDTAPIEAAAEKAWSNLHNEGKV